MGTRDKWEEGERAVFSYSLGYDEQSEICGRLYHRTGQVVTVLGEEESSGNDLRDELPTLADRAEAGAPLVYGVCFPDGYTDIAFEDELLTEGTD